MTPRSANAYVAKKARSATPGKSKPVCWDFQSTGKCKRGGDCHFEHTRKGPQRSPGPTGAPAGQWNRSRSPGGTRHPTPRTKSGTRQTCKHWQKGTCRNSTPNCRFKHGNDRGRSPGRAGRASSPRGSSRSVSSNGTRRKPLKSASGTRRWASGNKFAKKGGRERSRSTSRDSKGFRKQR
jgi:hypothetical protein